MQSKYKSYLNCKMKDNKHISLPPINSIITISTKKYAIWMNNSHKTEHGLNLFSVAETR